MSESSLPFHPRTGLQAAGFRKNGQPIWPILGGSEPAGEGGAGDNGDQGGQGSAFEPITSQEALNALIQDRVRRAQEKGFKDAEGKYKAGYDKHTALEAELADATTKAVNQAKAEAEAQLRGQLVPRVVKAEFKAAAKGVLTGDQLDALLEDLDLTKYVGEDGEPDASKIEKKITAFAPAKGGGGSGPRPGFGQGSGLQTAPPAKRGEAGLAEAQRRFGKKS